MYYFFFLAENQTDPKCFFCAKECRKSTMPLALEWGMVYFLFLIFMFRQFLFLGIIW
jgi:hypothetical protein